MNPGDRQLEDFELRTFKLVTRLRIRDSAHSRERLERLVLDELLLASNEGRVEAFDSEKDRVTRIMQRILAFVQAKDLEKIEKLAKNVLQGPSAYSLPEGPEPRRMSVEALQSRQR